ncbi:hypothetical protein C6496_15690 [Candidatus Poribacteria bacterium]|nr:MAG: hypothetical protein C6496_15690 [Candidatus Poribacteria bacterium]
MPVGGAPGYDRVPQSFGGERFLRRQRIEDWGMRQWYTSWGIQIYTGIPSECDAAQWHDLEFKYEAICAAPDVVFACIETLVNVTGNPLLTLTKSGGLRFSCRVPDYLHPNTEESRFYIYKDIPTAEDSYQRDVYLEILGEAGHSPWDARYEILLGDLLKPPIITKEVLFASVDALREGLHDPTPLRTDELRPASQNLIASLPVFSSHKLDLAEEALLKRRFTYLREESGFHHWAQCATDGTETNLLLWESEGIVWIRACTANVGLPTEDTPITDVWNDTGILPPIPTTGLPVSEKVLSVRAGKLSPLAVKRSSPVLRKSEGPEKDYKPLEKSIAQVQSVFGTEARVIGLTTEIGARNNYQVEAHLLRSSAVSFNAEYSVLKEAIRHFQRYNLPSPIRWKNYNVRWERVKDIPVEVRMATPFQHGNVCEDADRCHALVEKGADPSESICPKCPAYAACQERGYLSQSTMLQRAKTQIPWFPQVLLDPNYSALVEELLQPLHGIERLCIIDEVEGTEMFLKCGISKDTLKVWCINWQGSTLGNFAQALLNVLEVESEPNDIAVKRLRIVVRAFQLHEAELVRQMCQVNMRCKVVERGVVDDETKEELAHFTVVFKGGVSAYIPLNSNAATRLATKGFLTVQLESFKLNKNIRIPMSIEQAIQLGILDTGTVEKIQEFPSVYRNPDWTFWHQLKRFLTHYPRDADAPMIWHNNVLEFWVPPVLHPSVKKLMLMSATSSEQDFRRAFPDEEIETISIKPTSWVEGNQVFQIRTGTHTARTILDYDSTWDVIGLSKMGERFLLGICAEIERDPNVKHGIITYAPVIKQLQDIAKRKNVCLLTIFKNLNNLDAAFEASEVVWIVGTPFWQPGVIWRQAQILYGNDEEPLCYEAEFQHYKDERIQSIYRQNVANVITEIIGRVGLNRWRNKKVVLISSLEIPDVTDRPETFLFDWEDFEVAGSLDKLAETISIRQQFETERASLTAKSSRVEVERVLGCSSRQANRMLNKLRGGNIPRVTFREQILSLLADGEKKMAEMTAAIDGHPQAIHKELVRLTKIGEIEKVRWGVYSLPKASSSK